jgi:transcriptional regulator with XRE-family HTH domain
MNLIIPIRLRAIRQKNGLTMLEVAQRIRKQAKAYQAYEEGRAEPSLDTFMKLKNLYGFRSIDDMLTGTDAKIKRSAVEEAYLKATAEKRRIVDFVLEVRQ